jgi:hypothetical protein
VRKDGHLPRRPVPRNLWPIGERLEPRFGKLGREYGRSSSTSRHLPRDPTLEWVTPGHPLFEAVREDVSPGIASMVRDEEIERLAVEAVTAYENARGWAVESVEKDNRGFDLISRRPHPEDPATAIEVRFIEVKGRAAVGEIALTSNEYKTAERLKKDYWLYAVFNCAADPKVHLVHPANPAARSSAGTPVVPQAPDRRSIKHYAGARSRFATVTSRRCTYGGHAVRWRPAER